MDLQGVVGDLEGGVGDEAFGHGAPAGGVRRFAIEAGGSLIQHQAGRLQFRFHVGEFELGVLEVGDGLAELLALFRIGDRLVEGELGAAERAGGDVEPAAIKACHGEAEAVALFADAIGRRHTHAIENDLAGRLGFPAHLALVGAKRKPRRILLDDEGGDALGAIVRRARHEDVNIRRARAGDELFGAGDDIIIAVFHGLGLEAGGIRA